MKIGLILCDDKTLHEKLINRAANKKNYYPEDIALEIIHADECKFY